MWPFVAKSPRTAGLSTCICNGLAKRSLRVFVIVAVIVEAGDRSAVQNGVYSLILCTAFEDKPMESNRRPSHIIRLKHPDKIPSQDLFDIGWFIPAL
jgi:hypothetical protein